MSALPVDDERSTGPEAAPFYFAPFESRTPPAPIPHSTARELLWQVLVTIALVLGARYIVWRWTSSLNFHALWFAIPLAVAETGAYIGLALFAFNLWRTADTPMAPPPETAGDCGMADGERPVAVDVFIATYNEDPELVRLSIRDANALRYPHPIDLRVHVLDDGRRTSMRAVAAQENAGYITRSSNIGFKAGNLRNAMEQTSGDFLVICDADTRTFPTLLEHTLGYFRDPQVAWVQTPQWFYDLPSGRTLDQVLGASLLGPAGAAIGRGVQRLTGELRFGQDPFANDPQMFYDAILRRRNRVNASFCCGAGSIHRREAVMETALKNFGRSIEREVEKVSSQVRDAGSREELRLLMSRVSAEELELTPYKFHVSEDIYTSIVMHSDAQRKWKSVFHPFIESRMLSPQDLQSWVVQRFKYAGGTLDIMLHDNPMLRRGSGMSWPQRLLYAATFWSYLGGIWNLLFLLAPIVFLFSMVSPLASYSTDFLLHILPFLFASEVAFLVGTWGISNGKGKNSYISFFPLNLRALWTVLRGKQIKFPTTPKERQEGTFGRLVLPQMIVIALTILGLAYYAVLLATGVATDVAAFVSNAFWGLNNVIALSGIVSAAFWKPVE
ncbi:MAG TPA: cellulose synthase catalytic subunit [Thermoanaerobaculia bacterium]|nr:cellulose synthase catalytic subunit [Thermoanaerobaculia bacterium]